MFQNKTILITGGTGSFGNAFVRHLLTSNAAEIRILSRDEAKQDLMRHTLKDRRLRYHVGDVRDPASVRRAVQGAQLIFHAAALKQVPSCEFFPEQAIQTNVLGSQNVLDAAVEHGVERMVCLSTDKAVYPINAMGMTKALMEKLVQAKARDLAARGNEATVLAAVRYGNVLNTRGSVVPLFFHKIRRGEALTLTVPEMTRFLLRLADAIGLIEHALAHARQGDLFVRRSPACTVQTMAETMLALTGARVPIEIIGMRHGEKIHETLATFAELSRAEDMGDFIRVPMDERDIVYDRFVSGGTKEGEGQDYTSAVTLQLDRAGTADLLMSVPEVVDEVKAIRG